MSIITEIEKGWVAGIIDGEGCIWENNNRPMLEVFNTDIRMLQKLKELFDGGIYNSTRLDRPNSKPCWRWTLTGNKARYCLNMILPFLIIKGEKTIKILAG